MKLNRSIFVLFAALFFKTNLVAETTTNLHLRAFVRHSIKTSIRETQLKNNKTLWLITSRTNTLYPLEGQKFEVLGMDQAGLEAEIKHIVGSDHTIQHEILISSLKFRAKDNRPIFLKISAN
ncbi:MAG: hypothetical protein WC635_05390 [Bacteriovorax sp.]|jgi:hypothetical protein